MNFLFNAKKFPIVVFNACLCSRFTDSSQCHSWKIISRSQGGGIASYGYTGTSFGSTESDCHKSGSGWIDINLFDNLYTTGNLGQSWNEVIAEFVQNFGTNSYGNYRTVLGFELFGDPTLIIEDGPEPEHITTKFKFINKFFEIHPNIISVLRQLLGLQ